MQGEALAVGLAVDDVVGLAAALAVTLADAVPEIDAVNEGVERLATWLGEAVEDAEDVVTPGVPPVLELG